MKLLQDIDQVALYQGIQNYINLSDIHCPKKVEILSLLDKLICLKKWHGQNHPSMPSLLDHIVNILDSFNLLQFSTFLLLEQIRIEEFFLGFNHPDLAITLFKIGQTFVKNEQLLEAEPFLVQAYRILNTNNTRGKIYSLIIYNLGLVQYHKCSYDDAFEYFDLALEEQRVALGESHPDVADMCINIGDFQVELGALDDVMDKYLEALMILRMNHGTTHFKVCKILYNIGVVHKVRDDFSESLNAFYQALDIARNIRNKDEFIIIILYEIGLIYQNREDVKNMTLIFKDIIELIEQKLGQGHICIASVLNLQRKFFAEHGMIESSNVATKEMQEVLDNVSNRSHWNAFADVVIELFGFAINDIDCAAAAAA